MESTWSSKKIGHNLEVAITLKTLITCKTNYYLTQVINSHYSSITEKFLLLSVSMSLKLEKG